MKIITTKRPTTDGVQDELFETVAEAKVYQPFNELVELNQVNLSVSGILERGFFRILFL